MRIDYRFALGILPFALGAAPVQALAQSASELGAWDGLMLSPVGAFAPIARDPAAATPGTYDLSLRYGRWRYDADDVEHDNIGLTLTRSFGFLRSHLSVTLAYELVECPTCLGWEMGGVDLRSTLWNHAFAPVSGRPITMAVAVRASVGGARYQGLAGATSVSAALHVPLEIALPFGKSSQLRASFIPGIGYGRISTADVSAGGVLPIIGGAVAWTITSFLAFDVGVQRVIIRGGPSQLGAALTWKFHTSRGEQP